MSEPAAFLVFLCALFFSLGCAMDENPDNAKALIQVITELRPLHKKLGKPGPNDWLAHHREPGQTFREYLECDPVRPDKKRNTIYIQPLGSFTETQERIVKLTAEFMRRYFSVPVKIEEDLPLSIIPDDARRIHPSWGVKQILTSHVLDVMLKPEIRKRKDALAMITFTTSDLWPGEGWNFVFGQASLRSRVGVWSIYRNGDPDESEESFRLCLLRTIKTATHEVGHMLSMLHCLLYECNMCGSNHREESDRRPLALCPECLAKICWATAADPAKRFQALADFCQETGLKEEETFYLKSLEKLRK